MKYVAVVYKSKYGFTKRYAQWIADALDADLLDASRTAAGALAPYRTIVFGGGLYASGINGVSLITKHFPVLKEKNLIVFTVGLADPRNAEQFRPILEKNFSPEMREQIRIFHLRGGMDYSALGMTHRAMMSMVRRMAEKKDESKRTDEDRELLETFGKTVDFTDRDSIAPLVDCCRDLTR